MPHRFGSSVLLLGLIVLGIQPTFAQEILLRHQLPAGDLATYQAQISLKGSMTLEGMPEQSPQNKNFPFELSLKMVYRQEVESVDPEGNLVLHIQYQSMEGMGLFKGKSYPLPQELTQKLQGKSIRIKVNPLGEVISISDGGEKFINNSNLLGYLSGSIFPKEGIKVGVPWKKETVFSTFPKGITLDKRSPQKVEISYTLQEVKDINGHEAAILGSLFQLDQAIQIIPSQIDHTKMRDPKMEGKMFLPEGVVISISGKGVGQGVTYISTKTGKLFYSGTSINLNLLVHGAMPPSPQNPNTPPMNITLMLKMGMELRVTLQ